MCNLVRKYPALVGFLIGLGSASLLAHFLGTTPPAPTPVAQISESIDGAQVADRFEFTSRALLLVSAREAEPDIAPPATIAATEAVAEEALDRSEPAATDVAVAEPQYIDAPKAVACWISEEPIPPRPELDDADRELAAAVYVDPDLAAPENTGSIKLQQQPIQPIASRAAFVRQRPVSQPAPQSGCRWRLDATDPVIECR